MIVRSFQLIVVFIYVSNVTPQQCRTNKDCTTPDAPYCSRWGWCQWTSRHGTNGPPPEEDELLAAGSEQSKRSFPANQPKSVPGFDAEFKITDYSDLYADYDYFGNYDILKKDILKDDGSSLDSSIFGGNVQLVTVSPIIEDDYVEYDDFSVPTRTTADDALRGTSGLLDVRDGAHEAVEQLDRAREAVEQLDGAREAVGQLDGAREPVEQLEDEGGQSQGCLLDCVNDCVSIDELTAYRDCVHFCGRTCEQ